MLQGKKPKGFSNPREVIDESDGSVHTERLKIENSINHYLTAPLMIHLCFQKAHRQNLPTAISLLI